MKPRLHCRLNICSYFDWLRQIQKLWRGGLYNETHNCQAHILKWKSRMSTDQGRSASSPPASPARWSCRWPPCGLWTGWRWGSRGRRGRPAKPLTPVSAAPLWTCEDQKICDAKYDLKKCFKEISVLYSLPSPLLSSLLSIVQHFMNLRIFPEIFNQDFEISTERLTKSNWHESHNKQSKYNNKKGWPPSIPYPPPTVIIYRAKTLDVWALKIGLRWKVRHKWMEKAIVGVERNKPTLPSPPASHLQCQGCKGRLSGQQPAVPSVSIYDISVQASQVWDPQTFLSGWECKRSISAGRAAASMHYRLTGSIGLLNVKKVSKSRWLFLTEGASKTNNFALFVKIMTQIFCSIVFSQGWQSETGQKSDKCLEKPEGGLRRSWFFVW